MSGFSAEYIEMQSVFPFDVLVSSNMSLKHVIHTLHEGCKIVTLTHRPSLLPGVSWYSFLESESTPGHMIPSVASEKNDKLK